MLPSYEEILYKDSGKVLRAIQEIIDRPEVLALLGLDTSTVVVGSGRTAHSTLGLIVEEIENAAKTSNIIPKTEGPLSMDTRNHRSRQRIGGRASFGGLTI